MMNIKNCFSWKRVLLWGCWIAVAVFVSACLTHLPGPYKVSKAHSLLVMLVAVPLLLGSGLGFLNQRKCRVAAALILVFAAACVTGVDTSYYGALLFVPLLSSVLLWMTNKVIKKKANTREYTLMVAGGLLFFLAQFAINVPKIVLLSGSALVFAYVFWLFYKRTHRAVLSVAMLLVCGFILPTLTIGYNQYTVLDGRRLWVVHEVDDVSRGLLAVCNEEGFGFRDRYGIVIPMKYDNDIHALKRNNTFFCAANEHETRIYDIRTHKSVIVAKEKAELIPVGRRTFKAVKHGTDSVIVYVQIPYISSDFDKIVISKRKPEEA